jgi:predicted DNA-binding transcriptional regulator AlpA
MSTDELLEKLLTRLAPPALATTPAQPISIALWDTNDIAAYLKRSRERVYSDIVCLPTFPKPIRLPVKGRAQALYKAREVIAWTEKHTS